MSSRPGPNVIASQVNEVAFVVVVWVCLRTPSLHCELVFFCALLL